MDPILVRLAIVLVLTGAVVIAGWWWRSRDGRISTRDHERVDAAQLAAVGVAPVAADAPADALTGVLLGSPTCAPCESAKRVLAEVAEDRPDFRWVYADAADHPELVAAHRVMRVPTLLVVGPEGRLVARTSGVPRQDELRRVLDGRVEGDTAERVLAAG